MEEEYVTPQEWLMMYGYTQEEVDRYFHMKSLEELILYPNETRVYLGCEEDNKQKIGRLIRRREEESMMKLTNLKWTKSPR